MAGGAVSYIGIFFITASSLTTAVPLAGAQPGDPAAPDLRLLPTGAASADVRDHCQAVSCSSPQLAGAGMKIVLHHLYSCSAGSVLCSVRALHDEDMAALAEQIRSLPCHARSCQTKQEGHHTLLALCTLLPAPLRPSPPCDSCLRACFRMPTTLGRPVYANWLQPPWLRRIARLLRHPVIAVYSHMLVRLFGA